MFCRFKVRNADTALQAGCNDQCHRENLCGIVTSEFEDEDTCKY